MIKKEQELRWRAYYGFKPDEYCKVKEEDLERAKYVQGLDKIIILGSKQIRGNTIIRIEQDFRFYTGWYDDFSPTNDEDKKQIERDTPVRELEARERLADKRVAYIRETGKINLLTEPKKIDQFLPETEGVKFLDNEIKNLSDRFKYGKEN